MILQNPVNPERILGPLQQGIEWILNFFRFIWRWSFGQVVEMFRDHLPNFGMLPLWKEVLMVVVMAAIILLLYYVISDMFASIMRVLEAFVSLLRAIVMNLPQVVLMGLVAFGGSWAVNNVTISWLP